MAAMYKKLIALEDVITEENVEMWYHFYRAEYKSMQNSQNSQDYIFHSLQYFATLSLRTF